MGVENKSTPYHTIPYLVSVGQIKTIIALQQHSSSLLFFHFYNRWAKKRKTPVSLVPRYVCAEHMLALHRHVQGATLTNCSNKMKKTMDMTSVVDEEKQQVRS